MGEVILEMKGIDKSFPGVHALDHVDLEIRKGEVLALMGENGAGKSTLMKVLTGIYTKDSGTITMEAFIENHGHYFREMTEYTENASDKETAAKELAVDFTDKVYDAYVSPKKGKIDSAVQTDLNFFMIYYVFPAILLTEHDDAKLIADHLCSRWGEKFKNSKIQYTDYDSLYVSFREKIFGIF